MKPTLNRLRTAHGAALTAGMFAALIVLSVTSATAAPASYFVSMPAFGDSAAYPAVGGNTGSSVPHRSWVSPPGFGPANLETSIHLVSPETEYATGALDRQPGVNETAAVPDDVQVDAAPLSPVWNLLALEDTPGSVPPSYAAWYGFGGHRLVEPNHVFPVFCLIPPHKAPAGVRLVVSREGQPSSAASDEPQLSWSTPVQIAAEKWQLVEAEAVAGDAPEDESFHLRVCSDDTGRILWEQDFRMITSDRAAYWVTPCAPGAALFMPDAKQVPPETSSDVPPKETLVAVPSVGKPGLIQGRRLDLVSPALLPTDPDAWPTQNVVVIDLTCGPLTAPQDAALSRWLAEGGSQQLVTSDTITSPLTAKDEPTRDVWERLFQPVTITSLYATRIQALRGYSPTSAPQISHQDAEHILSRVSAPEPHLTMPGWPAFLIMSLAYVVVFGPLSLWLTRRVRRVLLVWLFIPGTALGLSVVILATGAVLNRAMNSTHIAAVAVVPAGGTDGAARADVVYFTVQPGSGRPDMGPLRLQQVSAMTGQGPVHVQDDSRHRQHEIQLDYLPSFGERHFAAEGQFHLDGELQVHLNDDGSGWLRNATPHAVGSGVLVGNLAYHFTPALGPGETYSVPSAGWKPLVTGSDFQAAGLHHLETLGLASTALWAVPAPSASPLPLQPQETTTFTLCAVAPVSPQFDPTRDPVPASDSHSTGNAHGSYPGGSTRNSQERTR